MDQARWSMPWIFGSIAVLAVIVAIAAGSYHITASIVANLKAAGVNPQQMYVYKPPTHPSG